MFWGNEVNANADVPCAVFNVDRRGRQLMIPAKRTCPKSWTMEYEGMRLAGYSSKIGV